MATKPISYATPQELVEMLAGPEKDVADIPMGSNKLSPKEMYRAIQNDVNSVTGKGKYIIGKYPGARQDAMDRVNEDSDVGRFAAPGMGDQGQFAGSSGSEGMKKGGKIKHYKSASAAVKAAEKRGDKSITIKFKQTKTSKRGDGIAQRGHTRGRMR